MLLSGKKGLDALLAEYGSGASALPDIAHCYTGGRLVVCGDAAGVWDDLEAFGCRLDIGRGRVAKDGWQFMAVNRIGETFPGDIEHWFSNAAHLLKTFAAARRQEYAKEFAVLHFHACQPGAAWVWPWPAQGTSLLGGVLTGIGLGYDRIVICGGPLDDGPHNGEPPWRKTIFATSEAASEGIKPEKHWARAIDLVLKGRVKSMSGRTREWLGHP